MARKIALSDKTKQLMVKLAETQALSPALIAAQDSSIIEQADLVRWLNTRPQGDKKNEFLLESLSASLLNDLHNTLLKPQEQHKKKPDNRSKRTYWLLAIAGIFFFGCEGFDGITAMLEVFTLTPAVILATGVVFALLAITVFCAFDLVEIAKNLGIKNKNAPQLLDIYLREVKLITKIREIILAEYLTAEVMSVEALRENLELVKMLQAKQDDLDVARATMQQLGRRPALQAAKSITAAVAGIIFFSGGFFAGQTVALKVAELCFIPVVASSLPIVVMSLLAGAAAFSVYWYVERLGIENLIASYVGLDQEKIDELCGEKSVAKEKKNLTNLSSRLTRELGAATEKLKDPVKVVHHKDSEPVSQARVLPAINDEIVLGSSRHGFLANKLGIRRVASTGDLLGMSSTQSITAQVDASAGVYL
ncbi:hypothetical protein [Legionella feeleii]|uniref:Coiled-coil protein n=1 Tax=Legionella feeleii TaxID=453 RepID=A0A0W0TMZ3_9GAMM|nr:hypothetical protein [Legionella feeleii]KTC96970.1 coiled-coil protein [Legionella feeleii]SPX61579.1 coiled-coil protein [Legionella feeleii]